MPCMCLGAGASWGPARCPLFCLLYSTWLSRPQLQAFFYTPNLTMVAPTSLFALASAFTGPLGIQGIEYHPPPS